MKGKGWYGDRWRHGLAARGISTNKYYQKKGAKMKDVKPKSKAKVPKDEDFPLLPETIPGAAPIQSARIPSAERKFKQLRAERALMEEAAEQVKMARPGERAIALAEQGQFASAADELRKIRAQQRSGIGPGGKRLTALDKAQLHDTEQAIVSTFNAQAIQLAQAGLPLPGILDKVADASVLKEAERIRLARRTEIERATEGPLAKVARDVLPGALASTLETPAVGLKREDQAFTGLDDAIDDGVPDSKKDLADLSFVKTNAAVGREEDSALKPVQEDVPRLSESFDFGQQAGGTNPVMKTTAPGERSVNEQFDRQVNSFLDARRSLAKIDLNPFEKGNKAFDMGNREGLIKNIVDLQKQEARLRDNFNMVEQTRSNLQRAESHRTAFDAQGDNALFNFMKRGGERIAEQNRKINDIRADIINANEQVFSRRRMLEFRLQRLDSVVPPETDVPGEVTRFEKHKFDNPVLNAPNITAEAIKRL